jgi:uncharacterized protein (TIGR02271 family)
MSWWDDFKRALSGEDATWNEHEGRFRERHASTGAGDFDRGRTAYQYGFSAGRDDQYRGRPFEDIEPELRGRWDDELSTRSGTWDSVRGHVADAYSRGQETRVTRSEEELAIGKRTVDAGAINVHKSVETEHVSERVPLTREEVTVERHAVADGDRHAAADLGEDVIRVPITEEELVVEKRPVVKEEIVIRKTATTDVGRVEEDVRKERVHIDDTTRDSRDPQGR